MNLFKKIVTYGSMILVFSFGLTLSATASDFSDSLSKANQGDSYSQLVVAKAYMSGEGVTQSNEKGFEWALKSAKQGITDAQFIVGALYDIGQGVRQDNAKAYEWYLDAVINGDKDAFSAIDTMHDEGRISQQDYSTAREIVYGAEPSFDFVTGAVSKSNSDTVEKAYRKACDKGSRAGCLSIMSESDYFKKLADERNAEDQQKFKASRSRSDEPAPRRYQNTTQPSQRFVPIQIPQRSIYTLPGSP